MANQVGLRSERGPILLSLMLSSFLIAIDSTAVFIGVAVSAVLLVACTVLIPHVPISDEDRA